jgi:hypothetical protein
MTLQPSRDGALVDLLDRILAKGVILQADLVISVAGVPLIGVNLKAAIAGLTTMVDYGMMETWDEKIRKHVLAESEEEAPLAYDERIILKTFGSHYFGKSAGGVWRSGYLYLTNKRLFLFRKKPAQILFETPLDKIRNISIDTCWLLKSEKKTMQLWLHDYHIGVEPELLRAEDLETLRSRLEEKITGLQKSCVGC